MDGTLESIGASIDAAYTRSQSFPEREHTLALRIAAECSQILQVGGQCVTDNVDALFREWPDRTIERYFELTVVALLAAQSGAEQESALSRLLRELDVILEARETRKSHAGAQALVESLMFAIEDVESKTRRDIMELLARLANAPEGVIPPSKANSLPASHSYVDKAERALLRDLLQVGLYREVSVFLEQRRELEDARARASSLHEISTPVVSFASRKGGVGKSMLTLAVAAWYCEVARSRGRVCILDFDLSGPVWQHVLFQDTTKPSRFLNDLLRVEQGNQKGEFQFPEDLTTADVEPLLTSAPANSEGARVSLLSVADLPRTSRYLSVAVANNAESFFRFVAQLLSALQPLTDLVIIDNPPGFGSLPLLSHVVATGVRHGCSIIVSTPALHDLGGTIIELSDLNLLEQESELVQRGPLWIVNKADRPAQEFLSTRHRVVDIANEIGAYSQIRPHRPLIERAVSSGGHHLSAIPLPLDPRLFSFATIGNREGNRSLAATLTSLRETDFFKAFDRLVGDAMRARLGLNEAESMP